MGSIPIPQEKPRRVSDPRLRRHPQNVRQNDVSTDRTVQISFSNDRQHRSDTTNGRQHRSDTSNGRLNQSDDSNVRHIRITKKDVDVDKARDESRFKTFKS